MVVAQGEIWWADLGLPVASQPGFRRPVLVLQGDSINQSRISTVICVAITSNLQWADAPGNVQIEPEETGLPKPSVINCTQIVTLDRSQLTERVGTLSASLLRQVMAGMDIIFDRSSAG